MVADNKGKGDHEQSSIASCDTLLCRCQGRVADAAREISHRSVGRRPRRWAVPQRCRSDPVERPRDPVGRYSRESPLLASQAPQDVRWVLSGARIWCGQRRRAPRLAALIAMARLPEPSPSSRSPTRGRGRLAILGAGPGRWHGRSDSRARRTARSRSPCSLRTRRRWQPPSPREIPAAPRPRAQRRRLAGRLRIAWTPANPVDASRCTGCGALPHLACSSDAIVRDSVAAYVDLARAATTNGAASKCAGQRDRLLDAPAQLGFDLVRSRPAASCHGPSAARLLRAAGRPWRWRRPRWRSPSWWASSTNRALVIQAQRVPIRAAGRGAAHAASTTSRPRRSAPTATTSASTRTCAWAAAYAPTSAPRGVRYQLSGPALRGRSATARAALGTPAAHRQQRPTVLFHGRKGGGAAQARAGPNATRRSCADRTARCGQRQPRPAALCTVRRRGAEC